MPLGPTPPDDPQSAQWGRSDWVSASDVSTYLYCPKAYELARVRRVAPSQAAVARRLEGTAAHQRVGRWFGLQRRATRWALWLVLLAGAVAALLTWLRGRS